MSSFEKPGPEIRFSEWRPIGICDQGGPHEQKAIMFNEKELAMVAAPGIDRQNWQSHPQIIKLIQRHSKKLAKISTIAKRMARPGVSDIRLVGMVLQFSKTPTLNQESEEGRVQLFQISFIDQGRRKPWLWKVLLGLISIFVVIIGILYLLDLEFEGGRRTRVVFCDVKRSSPTYAAHLDKAQQHLKAYIQQMPSAYRQSCYFKQGPILLTEEQLLTCLLSVQTAAATFPSVPDESLQKVNQCVNRICLKNLKHLQPYCRQLHF
ncbi:MAG: hypothetical protein HQM13_14105 [SAR324 cluster bacterium]|nr:hypothetical protein [SAR324 cluster bacterium]